MATKKSSKSHKTKTTKSSPVDHNHLGKCFIALGLVLTALLFGFFYYLGQSKTYSEQQKLLAFDSLVESYLNEDFTIDGKQSPIVTGSGLTDDNDLYYDFVIAEYDNHTIVSFRPARLHFQCHEQDSLKLKTTGCSRAYWQGDWESTSAEYQAASREFYTLSETLTARANATEDQAEQAAIKKEYQAAYDKFIAAIKKYGPEFQKSALTAE